MRCTPSRYTKRGDASSVPCQLRGEAAGSVRVLPRSGAPDAPSAGAAALVWIASATGGYSKTRCLTPGKRGGRLKAVSLGVRHLPSGASQQEGVCLAGRCLTPHKQIGRLKLPPHGCLTPGKMPPTYTRTAVSNPRQASPHPPTKKPPLSRDGFQQHQSQPALNPPVRPTA